MMCTKDIHLLFFFSRFNKREVGLGYMVENEVIKARRVVALDTAVGGGLWGTVFIMIK